ncbi:hypothetical protein K493DRAFT_305017 [Basidiobolus meristosporus CBS 931.73]|uniref:Uncharacterized protein n=1 Tax=Basidiobolus meristosporus CBS 931.73 TaxID=1314790 RepID=A0A1Y1XWY4_9FUNG|nr:hypothetical protein K493DRAFT_305017 [Basidiobolus meristosporus CBS 931.73]|eukprot:ORX90271.1 hypothetical protein K493DRAFT_305017 [Basidiobolus meristosporus CBS 931.73]
MNLPRLVPIVLVTVLLQGAVEGSVKRGFSPANAPMDTPPHSTVMPHQEVGREADPYAKKDTPTLLLGMCLGSSFLLMALVALVYLLISRRKNKIFPEPPRNLPFSKHSDPDAICEVNEKHFKEIMTILDAEEGYSASLHIPPTGTLHDPAAPTTKSSSQQVVLPKPVKDGSWRLSRLKLGSKFENSPPPRKFLRDSYQVW